MRGRLTDKICSATPKIAIGSAMSILDHHRDALVRLAEESRLRRLMPRSGLDFSSNDYLGLANAPEMKDAIRAALDRGVAVGAGGSRLLRGNDPEHEALEWEAASSFASESALFFANGFAANTGLFAALPNRHDLIVHDALIHASVHDGMRLSFAERQSVPHNDPQAFEDAITGWRAKGGKGRVWIAVESLYSMDGDRAPIAALADIADRHDAFLVIDEAHAAGIFGIDGRGLAAGLRGRQNVIRLVTCGKALGCEGALLLAPKVITDMLVNTARPFIFSTAPSPLMAVAALAALRLLDQPERRETLHRLIRVAGEQLGFASGSQIIPIIIGDDAETMRIAGALQEAGFDVRGIRPPTVPKGTSRLRISITLNVTENDIAALGDALRTLRG
jgi:8-amino-7-oxononanoate synthase